MRKCEDLLNSDGGSNCAVFYTMRGFHDAGVKGRDSRVTGELGGSNKLLQTRHIYYLEAVEVKDLIGRVVYPNPDE